MEQVAQVVDVEVVEMSFKEVIAADQQQNRSRVETGLMILPKESQRQIQEACKFSSYYPNPITKPFMRKYILSKLDFPTKGSELAQSLTELNVRIENLFTDAASYKKADLDVRILDVQIRKLEAKLAKTDDALDKEEIELEIEGKRDEQVVKKVSFNKIKLAAMSRYNEAAAWKGCVEDIMVEMNVKSLDEVDFDRIRMDEMAAKIEKWGELAATEQLEMTPSKFNAIQDNIESFNKGFTKGHERMAMLRQLQETQRQANELEAKKQKLLQDIKNGNATPNGAVPPGEKVAEGGQPTAQQ